MHRVAGFKLGTTSAGIKTPGRSDLVVMELQPGSAVAGVFTQNAFCAAPVVVAKQHLSSAAPRYLVTNTGNANAGTGEQGMTDALQSCDALAAATSSKKDCSALAIKLERGARKEPTVILVSIVQSSAK